jgi:serine/threonine protein kinase
MLKKWNIYIIIIIHRDLKYAGIFLIKKGVLKIGDLNVSKVSQVEWLELKLEHHIII